MTVLITFVQKAIMQGVCMLFGADGEILTEKSGNLNLGVPGMMYMGGIAGLIAAFYYEKAAAHPNGLVGMILSLLAAFLMAAFGGLIFSVLTITLRANQNVAGLALTTFGVGFGNFFGGSLSTLAGGVGQISVAVTGDAYRAKLPFLSKIPVIGEIFFNYGFLTYFAIIITLLMAFFLKRTRWGLNLNAVGESPATADAAGINVTLYKYLAWNTQEEPGRIMVLVTEDGLRSRLLFLPSGSPSMQSGDPSYLADCIFYIFIYRDLEEVCRKSSRCFHIW